MDIAAASGMKIYCTLALAYISSLYVQEIIELKTKPLSTKLSMCTAGQDPGFHTMCQRVSNPRPCWGAMMVLLGDCGQGKKRKPQPSQTSQQKTLPWLVFFHLRDTYFSQAKAFRDNIPKSLEDACPSFPIGCYGER